MTVSASGRRILKSMANLVFVLLTLVPAGAALGAQCDVVATPLGFGTYDPFNPVPLTATSNLSISCKPPNKAFSVSVQLTSGSGSFAQRSMASASGGQMFYNIYTDASYLTVFGDGTGGSLSPSRTVTKSSPWNLTLYGRVPAMQNLLPGVYADTLTATIFF